MTTPLSALAPDIAVLRTHGWSWAEMQGLTFAFIRATAQEIRDAERKEWRSQEAAHLGNTYLAFAAVMSPSTHLSAMRSAYFEMQDRIDPEMEYQLTPRDQIRPDPDAIRKFRNMGGA